MAFPYAIEFVKSLWRSDKGHIGIEGSVTISHIH